MRSHQHYLEIISRHTDRLINIVKDLMLLSSLEHEQELELEKVNIKGIAEQVKKIYVDRLKEKNLYLNIEAENGPLIARVDPFKLEQVFINLIDNAIKYTETGGITVQMKPAQAGLVIRVADTGIGIAAPHLPKLFERFYVVDKSRSRKRRGHRSGALHCQAHCPAARRHHHGREHARQRHNLHHYTSPKQLNPRDGMRFLLAPGLPDMLSIPPCLCRARHAVTDDSRAHVFLRAVHRNIFLTLHPSPVFNRDSNGMSFYLKRIIMTVPTLLGISIITFVLLQALPGDPVQGLAGDRADPAVLERIRRDMGTDRPIALQYVGYMKLLMQGELGRSYYSNRSVLGDIAQKLPNTIMLAAAAMLFSTCFGILLGIFMAVRRGTVWDRLALMLSTAGISLPVFWLGLLLIYLFSFKLQLLPPAGMGSGLGGLVFLALPAATLGLSSAAALARITRTSMLEVLSQPYITTARAKGLSGRVVVFKHAFKNTLIPVVTLIGLDFGSYLNGSILTETIFGWDGIGRYAVEGIFQRDYPVIMGCVLTGALLFVLVNLSVDLVYGLLDPRIAHAPAESQQ